MRDLRAIDLLLLAPLCWDEVVDRSGRRVVPGGAAFYACHALARVGAGVELHTPLADSDRSLLDRLPGSVRVVVHPSRATTGFRIDLDPARPNERRLRLLGCSDPLDPQRLPRSPTGVPILLGPLLPTDLSDDLCRHLRAEGSAVDLGVQGLVRAVAGDGAVFPARPGETMLPPIRILAGDEEEIVTWGGQPVAAAARSTLDQDQAQEVIVTRADRGAWIFDGGSSEPLVIDPIPPPGTVRQVVGLGDTFLAIYVWERSLGRSAPVAGRRAAEAASRLMVEGVAS
jgi:sugar/nucleoside kinase (ribokinase family)